MVCLDAANGVVCLDAANGVVCLDAANCRLVILSTTDPIVKAS